MFDARTTDSRSYDTIVSPHPIYSKGKLPQLLLYLALPGGEGQRVHMDGPQANLALVIALEDGTRATRFAGANADARKWDDCAEVRQLRAGEAVLFDTARWHAGPAQPTGAGVRVTLVVPLTGACWRRQGASDVVPVFLGEQAAA